MGDIAQIPLRARDDSIRAYALVDIDDEAEVNAHRWHLNRGYVMSYLRGTVRQHVLLHRFLLDVPTGLVVDHINHDKLDNRRTNLRVVTNQANCQNRAGGWGRSQHRGVVWRDGKWNAQAKLNGRCYHLGCFDSEEEAAMAASTWRREHMPTSVMDLAT